MTANANFKKLVRARMIETGERYTVARAALLADHTEAERFRTKTLRSFLRDGKLVTIPAKRRARVFVWLELLALFEPSRTYTEAEVNEILGRVHGDVAYMRRELIDYRFMTREASVYKLAEAFDADDRAIDDDLPADVAARFREATRGETPH